MRIQTSFSRLVAALFSCLAWSIASAQVSLTTIGSPVTQNFDSLPATGAAAAWADNSTLANWYAARQTAGTLNIIPGTGSSNTGQLYSFGAGTNTERALGSVSSGTPGTIHFAVRLANATSVALTALDIAYTCEQWRNGGNATQQRFTFEYQIAATGAITGANVPTTGWTALPALDCVGPIATATASALDGNLAANRTSVSATLSAAVPVSQEIWLRWVDINDTGNDHGMGIDDLSVTPQGSVVTAPSLSINDAIVNEGNAGTATASFTVSLSAPAPAGGVTFDIATADNTATTADSDYVARTLTAQTIPAGSTTFTFDVTINGDTTVEANETFFVNVTNVVGATVVDGQGLATITNDDTSPLPNLTIADVSIPEGNSGTSVATFTVSLSAPAGAGGVSFDIATADGSATIAGSDYVARSLTAQTIPAGSSTYTFDVTINGDVASEANETFFVNITNVIGANIADSQAQGTITNDDVALTPINQIQGTGSSSGVVGSTVTTRGIVTAAYPGFRGFYIQTPDADVDANPATSEGIFVFMNSATLPAAAVVGNLVQVTGVVGEFGTAPSTATQLGSGSATPTVTQISTGNPLPAAINVNLPLASATALEAYEGMRVSFSQTLTVSGNFTLGRFGEVILSANGRLINPSNAIDLNDNPPSGNSIVGTSNLAAITAAIAANTLNQVTLDDTSSAQNPDPAPFGLSAANTLRAGSTITGVTGIVNQISQGYRILSDPSNPPNFNRAARPLAPPAVGGTMKAAGFNVLNYFNGNGTNQDGAAGGYPTARGANNLNEFTRQRSKTIAAVSQLGADVVGLIEMENDGDAATSALPDLLNGLTALDSAAQWSSVALPTGWGTINGSTDAITTRLIYKNASVEPVGAPLFCDNASFVNARTPLAQVFRSRTTGGKVIVSINHFKSKSCGTGPDAATGLEADQNDGQGCWAPRRLAQAQALIACVANWQAAAGENRVLLLGDFNAYEQENAIDAFRAAGLVTLINDSYSFVFDGTSGALDHAIATPQLVSQVTGADKWHINADEPISLDYNTEFKTAGQQTSLYAPDPFRSSDHDPALVGMNLASDPAVVTITSVTSGAVFGQPINVAVTVAGIGTPSGNVTIAVGAASCVATLTAGAGNCSLSGVPVGAGQTVSANYAGDATNGAGSDTDSVTVVKANTTATITANTPNPSIVNSPVNVTVVVAPIAPGAGTPSGTITVTDGSANCTITLPATNCNLTPTTTGAKTITASYAGDTNFNASNATGVAQTVNAAPQAPVITNPTPPPAGVVSSSYSYQFTAVGNAPIVFAVTAGSLPPGLTLSSSGLLSGTPTAPGSYAFTVTASNGVLPNLSLGVTIVIAAAADASVAVPTIGAWQFVLLALLLLASVLHARGRASNHSRN